MHALYKEIQERTSFIINLYIIKKKSHFLKHFLFYLVVFQTLLGVFLELLWSVNTEIRSHLDLVVFVLFFFSIIFSLSKM